MRLHAPPSDTQRQAERPCGLGSIAVCLMPPPSSVVFTSAPDHSGAHTLNGSPVRSKSDGSSFSGLFTRLEMGHIVIGFER